MKRLILPCLLLCAMVSSSVWADTPIMTAADLAHFDNPPPDARIAYGKEPLQFGDLRLPSGSGPHPVMIFVHGGCWLSEYDITHSSKLTAAFAAQGIATWSLEYRRVGDPGGGWPGTFEDVAAGADHLRQIADRHRLDLGRVVFAGHSAGAQLALWLAARPQLPGLTSGDNTAPLKGVGVLALAPAADLAYLHEKAVCGHVVDQLIGGSPQQFPDRYAQVDPARLPRLALPQQLIIGRHDTSWTPVARRYLDAATARGDAVRSIDADASGHFEMIDPDSSTWPLVLGAARELLGMQAPQADTAAVPDGDGDGEGSTPAHPPRGLPSGEFP